MRVKPESEGSESADDVSEVDSDENDENINSPDNGIDESMEGPEQTQSNLESENLKANFLAEELTSDDEIYTIQCPSDFNTETLLHSELDLTSVTVFTQGNGDKFSCKAVKNNNEFVTCALPCQKQRTKENAVMMKVPLAGHIVIKKDFYSAKNLRESNFIAEETAISSFPTCNTERHPLLGKDWMQYANQAKKIIKCSVTSKRESERRNKSKHLKRKKNDMSELVPHKKKKRCSQ